MIRGEIVAGALLCCLTGPLGASMVSANPAEALFLSTLTTGEACRMTPENPGIEEREYVSDVLGAGPRSAESYAAPADRLGGAHGAARNLQVAGCYT